MIRSALGVTLLLVTLGGCAEVPGEPALLSVRDSAGVQIIEVEPRVWPPPEVWRIEDPPSFAVGVVDGDPDYELHEVQGVLPRSGGGVVVAEFGARLRYYDEEGRHLRTVDLRGEGPGEALMFASLRPFRGDSLALETFRGTMGGQTRREIMILDGEGRYGRDLVLTIPGPDVSRADQRAIVAGADFVPEPLEDGSFVAMTAGRLELSGSAGDRIDAWATLVRVYPGEARLDSIATVPVSRVVFQPQASPPLGMILGNPPQTSARSLGAQVFRGHPGRLAVDIHEVPLRAPGEEGRDAESGPRLVRSIRILVEETTPVDRWRAATIDLDVELMSHVYPNSDSIESRQYREGLAVADPLPVAYRVLPDAEGNLWFEPWRLPHPGTLQLARRQGALSDEEPSRWIVIAPDGELLGSVLLPGALEVYEIGAGHVLGVYRDEFGVEFVHRYRLLDP